MVRDENGVPVKEWYAIASYLDRMGDTMDRQYAQPDGRKVIYASWNPVKLLRNANKFTWILLAAIVLVILLVVGTVKLVRKLCRKLNRKKKS